MPQYSGPFDRKTILIDRIADAITATDDLESPTGSRTNDSIERLAIYFEDYGGIPDTDLTEAVRASLDKADSALQEHQSLAAYRSSADQDVIDAAQNTAINTKSTVEVWRLG